METNLVRKKEKILKWETVKLVLKSIENISFFCDFFNFLKKKIIKIERRILLVLLQCLSKYPLSPS